MYSTINPAVVALLALCSGYTLAEDLIADAGTITNTQSYTSAVSQSWASVYYRVNQNLNDALYAGKSKDYATATWLYGTTQLPAAYVANWAPGYLSRAQELHSKTASGGAASSPGSSSSEESDDESSSEESSSKDSAAAGVRALGSLPAVVIAAAALSVAGSFI
ncbi:hypothetical protein IWW47_001705 [Coemansia sp. RSA 2052]|nr:hypothetical protein IWW47_001705 [Coemansia sp. RSA 2052]